MYNWMSANKLSLNHDKSCYIIFNSSSTNTGIKLFLNRVQLIQVSTVKFLGITLDENLSFKPYIQELHSTIIKYCGIFYKIRNKIPPKVLKNLYFATIHPRLLYGIEIYANTCHTFLSDLQTLNNRLLRILQNKPLHTHVTDLYFTYNILPVDKLFQYQLLQFAYKLIYFKNILSSVFSNYFVLNNNIHYHNTRTKLDVHINRFSTSFGSRCIDNKCAVLWNSLPENIKNVTSINSFKLCIKNRLINL